MADVDTAADLATKLAQYREQLAGVQTLLATEPGNATYAKLVTDLQQVITLTTELHEAKKAEEAAAATAKAEAASNGGAGAGAGAGAGTAVAAAAPAAPTGSRMGSSFGPGARVEVKYDKSFFAAVVEGKTEDYMLVVRIIASGATDTVEPARCRALKFSKNKVPASEIAIGLRCQSRYSVDGRWYNCKINKETEHGYEVTYIQYGNTEVVPPEYLRHMPKSEAEKQAENAKEFVIPESLVPLPTDTEAEKNRKRKRIKMLKSKRRQNKMSKERDTKQATWQSFQAKSRKKKRPGFRTTMKKKSIFATGDDPSAKVGVTGSGRGMTEFSKRKKFKPDEF